MESETIIYGFGVGFNSAFNKALSNLSPYNISNGVGFLSVQFNEVVNCDLRLGLLYFIKFQGNENIKFASSEAAVVTFVAFSVSETFSKNDIYLVPFLPTVNIFAEFDYIKGKIISSSKFNSSRFNLLSFNTESVISSAYAISWVKSAFKEVINTSINIVGMMWMPSLIISEVFRKNDIYAITFLPAVNVSEEFDSYAYMYTILQIRIVASETFNKNANIVGMMWMPSPIISEVFRKNDIYAITFLPAVNVSEEFDSYAFMHMVLKIPIVASEKFSEYVNGFGMHFISVGMTEIILLDPINVVSFIRGFSYNTLFSSISGIAQNIRLRLNMLEEIKATTEISDHVELRMSSFEEINMSAYLTQNIKLAIKFANLIYASVSADSFYEKICKLNLTLEPGQRLIVDANTYSVWLDNENVVYTQSGDWIDELNRNTVLIEVLATYGRGALTARVIYQEKYL